MASPMIITYFNDKTFAEWKAANESKLFSSKRFKRIEEGSIILMINLTTHELVGVTKSRSEFRERHLLDAEVYHNEDRQYNRYEVDTEKAKILPHPIPLADLGRWCGIAEDDKTRNNITKGTMSQFARVFYKNVEREADILGRLRMLVANLL